MTPTGRTLAAAVAALMCFSAAGCARYQVGAGTLYAPDVQTVHVPVIESESFRRDLGERLTEAVCKRIETQTPFKVVGTPAADSVLTVRLFDDRRFVIAEDGFDVPRVLENQLHAEVTWLNRRRLPITGPQTIVLPPALVDFSQSSPLIPAGGQTVVTEQQQAIERLATQIVSAMEEPW
ncbi:MAG: LPS assembly lipoprotein LptE [Planctomycetota bacterium]